MFNRRAKFGLKIPSRLGKMSENFRGGIFYTVGVEIRAQMPKASVVANEPDFTTVCRLKLRNKAQYPAEV